MSNLIENYHHTIHSKSQREDRALPIKELLIWQDNLKKLTCYYAPFDHVNRQADIIIVGITPGRTQMNRSINALKLAMDREQDIDTALKSVKQHASLSGSMRPRIVEMLNRLGYAKLLDIKCCSGLWAEHNHRVHFCSVLKYPIFVNGKDYCGQPQQLTTFQNKVVAPPHPSGANAESIALLLRQDYPTLTHYRDEMYQQYRRKQSWLKRENSQVQDEERYKKARAARWQAMSHVRQAYGI